MKNNFIRYTDAPKHIEIEMERAVRVDDFLNSPEKLKLKIVSEKERVRTEKTWKRYLIKDHERGHRKPISEVLNEPTQRFDTSIILPVSVYHWLKKKPNKAAFIRETVIQAYSK